MTTLNVTGLTKEAQNFTKLTHPRDGQLETGVKEPPSPSENGTYTESKGGTEMMLKGLQERVDSELLDQYNIICSRVRSLSEEKPNILWMHDTWDDPECEHLKDPELRKRFKKIIFVSNQQQQTFNIGLGVPYSEGLVIQNAIVPIKEHKKPNDGVFNLIYHTTPHRGLELLVPVFEHMCKLKDDLKLHLDVYSSFEVYGWAARDEQYKELFDKCRNHPNITYHGYQPNEVVREALEKAHIYSYPNIWPETSGISLIEAMSAGCSVVAPNFAAIPETLSNFGIMYNWDEDVNKHANTFANALNAAFDIHWEENVQNKLKFQAMYVNNFYNWDLRATQWTGFLQSLGVGRVGI